MAHAGTKLIEVTGLDPTELLHRLWGFSQEMNSFGWDPAPLSVWDPEVAEKALVSCEKIEDLLGVPIHVNFGDFFMRPGGIHYIDPKMYDGLNGEGKVEQIVGLMRQEARTAVAEIKRKYDFVLPQPPESR